VPKSRAILRSASSLWFTAVYVNFCGDRYCSTHPAEGDMPSSGLDFGLAATQEDERGWGNGWACFKKPKMKEGHLVNC
jgi:hypothetical protein